MGPGLGKLVSCSTSIKIYEIIKLICQNPFIEQMFIENLLYATSSFVEQKIDTVTGRGGRERLEKHPNYI